MACIHQKLAVRKRSQRSSRHDHVEPGQPDDDDRRARLPGKATLDRLERLQPVLAQIAAPHRRQRDGGRHRDSADPDHDEQDVQGAGDDHVIHSFPRAGRTETPRFGAAYQRNPSLDPALILAQPYRTGGSTRLRWSKLLPFFDTDG